MLHKEEETKMQMINALVKTTKKHHMQFLTSA